MGILRCGKMLQPQLNLVIEIEFAHPEIQNVRVLASQVVLDSALVEPFNRPRCTRSSPRCLRAWRSTTSRRAPSRNLGAFVTFWDNDAGSKIHLLANPGLDVAPIGAARQEDSLLEAAGQPAVPAQPYEGSLAERVPKMPLSGVSTRSGDLAWFTFKALDGTMTDVSST